LVLSCYKVADVQDRVLPIRPDAVAIEDCLRKDMMFVRAIAAAGNLTEGNFRPVLKVPGPGKAQKTKERITYRSWSSVFDEPELAQRNFGNRGRMSLGI
jgi:hypothetical protein